MELTVKNLSKDEPLTFENCLHTYFEVGDISAVSIRGLKGVKYLDKVEHFAEKTETNESIQISSEVDRVYLNTTAQSKSPIATGKKNSSRKSGSLSTVVWNPWINKAQQMPDLPTMNTCEWCAWNPAMLAPTRKASSGERSSLKVKVSSQPLYWIANPYSLVTRSYPASRSFPAFLRRALSLLRRQGEIKYFPQW